MAFVMPPFPAPGGFAVGLVELVNFMKPSFACWSSVVLVLMLLALLGFFEGRQLASASPPSSLPSTIPVTINLREVVLPNGGTAAFVLRSLPHNPALASLGKIQEKEATHDVPPVVSLGYVSLALEVRSQDNAPFPVWAHTRALLYKGQQHEYAVLDHVLLPGGGIAFAMASEFGGVEVHEVGLSRPPQAASLPRHQWSLLAAAVPAKSGRLAARLRADQQDGRLTVVVADQLDETLRETTFEQRPGTFEFQRTGPSTESRGSGKPDRE